jgi:hypothetical protein
VRRFRPAHRHIDLRRSGLDASGHAGHLEVIRRLAAKRREELHPFFFDRTYSSTAPRFNTEPNALLVRSGSGPGWQGALGIHMGQGRNAIFHSPPKGWQVTGLISPPRHRAAREAAKGRRLREIASSGATRIFDFGARSGTWSS